MTQSEEDILTALIMQLTKGVYTTSGGNRYPAEVTESSARMTAKKILEVGFSMARRPVDDLQDEDIERIDREVQQLRGWAGLPPELRIH